jgi:hypothetical protein
MHVFNCDEGPGEKVVCADALEPGGLGREACGTVEVPDCAFNAREFVNIVDCFTWVGSTEELDMLYHGRRRGYVIEGVEGLRSGGAIKEERMLVEVGDICLEGDAPKILMGTPPASQDCLFRDGDLGCATIVDVDLVAVTDGNIACLCKFSTTEEGIALQGRNNVHGARGFPKPVVQLGHMSCWGWMPIGQSKHLGRPPGGGDEWVPHFASMQGTCGIPRCGRDGAIQYS